MEPENNSKERIMIELEAEMRLLEPSLTEILLMDYPSVRLSFESLFVLFCASVAGCIAWVIEQIGILPEWMMPPFTIVLSVTCAIAAVWTCVDSRRKHNRYFSLRDELEQLHSTGHDQQPIPRPAQQRRKLDYRNTSSNSRRHNGSSSEKRFSTALVAANRTTTIASARRSHRCFRHECGRCICTPTSRFTCRSDPCRHSPNTRNICVLSTLDVSGDRF